MPSDSGGCLSRQLRPARDDVFHSASYQCASALSVTRPFIELTIPVSNGKAWGTWGQCPSCLRHRPLELLIRLVASGLRLYSLTMIKTRIVASGGCNPHYPSSNVQRMRYDWQVTPAAPPLPILPSTQNGPTTMSSSSFALQKRPKHLKAWGDLDRSPRRLLDGCTRPEDSVEMEVTLRLGNHA